jgi:predicted dehydrogenase
VPRQRITYNHEYDRKIRVGFIGAGGHSFRNVYPTFQYAPVDLIAICDRDPSRAAAYARRFGALRNYSDHREMLRAEELEAVFIVTSYDGEGRVQATALARDALQAGVHVWMEKPTAATSNEVRALMSQSEECGRFVMTGLKKTFFPAIEKVKEIIGTPEFGRPSSVYIRYPQAMPPMEARRSLPAMRSMIDHIYHPGSILRYLMGDIERLSYEWEEVNGGSVAALRFRSGAIGTLHLAAGASGSSFLERLEVVGEGCNITVDNGVRLTYYRKAPLPEYGRDPSFLVDTEVAPLFWEPEFSLGQLYNKNIFMLGYVQEILHFCTCILDGRTPTKGTLEDALAIMTLLEGFAFHPPGETIRFTAAERALEV